MMKIGVLTSSRADYGIYVPLLKALGADLDIELHVIAFGMHLLNSQGRTLHLIERDSFGEIHAIAGLSSGDSAEDITKQYGEIIVHFSSFWSNNHFDLVIALGDRFEMNAAVQSTIPHLIPIAHIHGGEKTLGAIDEIYRHQITLAASIHFTSTEEYADKVRSLVPECSNVYNVGALSLDGLNPEELPQWDVVRTKFAIPDEPFVLVTFHPETSKPDDNYHHIRVLRSFFSSEESDSHYVVTLANADTNGQVYRDLFSELKSTFPSRFTLIETFGRDNYYSAMKASKYLLGNTSSGIIEAASVGVYTINVGNRQEGRVRSGNVIDVPFDERAICEATSKLRLKLNFIGKNKYKLEDTTSRIIEKIKFRYDRL